LEVLGVVAFRATSLRSRDYPHRLRKTPFNTARQLSPPTEPPGAAEDGAAPWLAVAGFDGPLDLLLALARAQQIDLARLSIAALIEAFATALQMALASRATARLVHWAVWTVMAASLTELWSRLKLPATVPDARAATVEAEALHRQSVGRAEIEAAANCLAQRAQLGRTCFAAASRSRTPMPRAMAATCRTCCAPVCLCCACQRCRQWLSARGRRRCGPPLTRSGTSRRLWLSCRIAVH
jgi:hypothetical protein